MANRFPLLAKLQLDMLSATTPAEREHVMGQIQAQQAWVSSTSGQLQAATVMLIAERDNRQERADEALNKSADNQLAQARAEGYIQ